MFFSRVLASIFPRHTAAPRDSCDWDIYLAQHGLRKNVMDHHDKRDGHKGVLVEITPTVNKYCIAWKGK